jgi:hypothetical protein
MATKELRVPSPGELWYLKDNHTGNAYYRVNAEGKMVQLKGSFCHIGSPSDRHHTPQFFLNAVCEASRAADKQRNVDPDKIVDRHDGWSLVADDWRVFVADIVSEFIEERRAQHDGLWELVEELELRD